MTGAHLSTTPLIWSHAEFVTTVDEYLKKIALFK
jgi:GH15 family glucan-1,4-alpha-glucosidase